MNHLYFTVRVLIVLLIYTHPMRAGAQSCWALFLDDRLDPPQNSREWTTVRSVDEARSLILQRGCPLFISFDHDLGKDVETGYDFAKWLVNRELDGDLQIPDGFDFAVHSANPVGRENILHFLRRYLEFRFE